MTESETSEPPEPEIESFIQFFENQKLLANFTKNRVVGFFASSEKVIGDPQVYTS